METAGKELQLAPGLFCYGTALALFLLCFGTVLAFVLFPFTETAGSGRGEKIFKKIKKVHLKIGGQLVCI